jgi:hypothetical protein
MKNMLISKLYSYVGENNPDLLLMLDERGETLQYLSDKVSSVNGLVRQLQNARKPPHEIEEICMGELTADLRPSRYHYICNLLAEEFEDRYGLLTESGLLRTEAINLVNYCRSAFDDLRFSPDNEDNRFTRYAITGLIREYLEQQQSVNETVSNGLQQPPKIAGQY